MFDKSTKKIGGAVRSDAYTEKPGGIILFFSQEKQATKLPESAHSWTNTQRQKIYQEISRTTAE